jgi:hypothetical protein
LIRRLRVAYPGQRLRLQLGSGSSLPADLRAAARPHSEGGHEFGACTGSCIEVSTVRKQAYLRRDLRPYDVLVVDEAFQVTFADLVPLFSRADRFLLIGDPGQLPPLVLIDTEPFHGARYRIHAPAPEELLRHEPGSPVVKLSVTHRLPPDTVRFIQPALYPRLPFQSSVRPRQRRLSTSIPGRAGDAIDRAVDLLVSGATLIALVLPARRAIQPLVDHEATELMARIVERMLDRHVGPAGGPSFGPGDIGCVDPHVASGTQLVGELTARGIPAGPLMVDTPERWQGLQRPLIVGRHPLSGVATSAFDLEPGRSCVTLTRHLFACVLVAREGVEQLLLSHQHNSGARSLGGVDSVWEGLEMHRALWGAFGRSGRLIHV